MGKGFQLHTRFSAILAEHQHNLFVKNYSELMVNSRTEPGYFLKQLQAAFQDTIVNNLWNYSIATFQLELVGYFSRAKDKLSFQFSYTYDPCNIRLNLVSLKAILRDEFQKEYPIKGHPSRDLPSAGKVYQELALIQKMELINLIKEGKAKTGKGKMPK